MEVDIACHVFFNGNLKVCLDLVSVFQALETLKPGPQRLLSSIKDAVGRLLVRFYSFELFLCRIIANRSVAKIFIYCLF